MSASDRQFHFLRECVSRVGAAGRLFACARPDVAEHCRRLVEIGPKKKMKGPQMASDIDKAIQENMQFTGAGGRDLLSAGEDSNDGFIKAIGTLAQVIYIITPDDKREQTLNDAKLKLKTYLELLDAVAGPGSPTVQPSR